MNLFAFKKIHNSTFFEHKTAIIWAFPANWRAVLYVPNFFR
jgi:hypothetical protein